GKPAELRTPSVGVAPLFFGGLGGFFLHLEGTPNRGPTFVRIVDEKTWLWTVHRGSLSLPGLSKARFFRAWKGARFHPLVALGSGA
ncbi:MAG: hypothetical protein M3271_10965, partial [Actinomycetota bacterium]|nr:hypothetical protein [Actinomycetota bacterium]